MILPITSDTWYLCYLSHLSIDLNPIHNGRWKSYVFLKLNNDSNDNNRNSCAVGKFCCWFSFSLNFFKQIDNFICLQANAPWSWPINDFSLDVVLKSDENVSMCQTESFKRNVKFAQNETSAWAVYCKNSVESGGEKRSIFLFNRFGVHSIFDWFNAKSSQIIDP